MTIPIPSEFRFMAEIENLLTVIRQITYFLILSGISIPIEDVLALLKKNFTLGVLFEKWVGPDDRNSKNHIVQVSPRNISPNRSQNLVRKEN